MDAINNARRLRRDQTDEEKTLWRALRAGRFAGFKFRRQHPVGRYFLDFYCPLARLAIELDGFQHGLPAEKRHDDERERYLVSEGIQVLRFWNHEWNRNRVGLLLEIWNALRQRSGCVEILRKRENNRFVPPKMSEIIVRSKGDGSGVL